MFRFSDWTMKKAGTYFLTVLLEADKTQIGRSVDEYSLWDIKLVSFVVMRTMIEFLTFLCIMHGVASFSFHNVQPGAQVHRTVSLGQFTNIGSNVTIKYNAQIGSFVTISPSTIIGENTQIGSHSIVGQRCIIENDVIIHNFAKIGNDNTIRRGSILAGFTSIGNDVKFGNRVKVNQYAAIADEAEIGDDDYLDQYALVGLSVKVAPKAYIGMFSSIQPNAIVNALAVIHKFVEIPSGATVKYNEVVIRTPSSYELYQRCLPVESILAAHIEIAASKNTGSDAEFNNLLRSLMDSQINYLRTNCEQIPSIPEKLFLIKSLYLIRCHGIDRFKQNLQQVQETLNGISKMYVGNGQVFINGIRMECTQFQRMRRQLENEYHFAENSERVVLQPDIKKNFIKLLAIEQDGEREYRIENDTICSMLEQIRSGEREVTCANRSLNEQSNLSSNYC
ncbi:acyl-[acyl-carrier-protein]--UDP-N-acetylglucosamine O-acyltransferase-like [Sitodiplosis mosellana]|uniref:acyl-[acyl-carrier-protein]--UDP-N- acetylglucosamine O-acyltransferase-like n=1 Tax=Sitodiplosis mosellana TaxID=263140 RepID=UPI002444EB87|nr:acyl-[acyl-carrier-protein]--UDP-N-acetylglucosamine O-acyltransferase-like [Sitodiplosis mosellana]